MSPRRKPEFRNRFLLGDVVEQLRQLPKNSVHCVITSPPYWALRDYGHPDQLGLEPTLEEYVDHLVEVFAEVWRVLRPEGTLWLNMGDAFVGGRRGGVGEKSTLAGSRHNQNESRKAQQAHRQSFRRDKADVGDTRHKVAQVFDGHHHGAMGLRPKNLMGQPWRVAFALQSAGWVLRRDIIWAKPNPTPESTRDRPTTAHEYVFLFAKRGRYFYDADAIREPMAQASIARVSQRTFHLQGGGEKDYASLDGATHRSARQALENLASSGLQTANKRSVWWIPPQPSKFKHYAAFPEDLARDCILAGTSEAGCCSKCGRPWKRVVEKIDHAGVLGKGWHDHTDDLGLGQRTGGRAAATAASRLTVGWAATCKHSEPPTPCVVLDPFAGTGTVAAVAHLLGRDWVGIDISETYLDYATARLAKLQGQRMIRMQPALELPDAAAQLVML